MPNAHKIDAVDQLTKKFESSSSIYFTCYTGMNVGQATELRKQFRESGVDYFVSKNTLTKLAAANAGYEDKLDDFFNGQVGIAYADQDPASPARVIKIFNKENKDALEVLGLVFEGEIYSADKYREVADLPDRDGLLTMFVSGLSQPMGGLVGILSGAMSKLVGVLNSLKEDKS
jgi:large subunit ribosomal protein L10